MIALLEASTKRGLPSAKGLLSITRKSPWLAGLSVRFRHGTYGRRFVLFNLRHAWLTNWMSRYEQKIPLTETVQPVKRLSEEVDESAAASNANETESPGGF